MSKPICYDLYCGLASGYGYSAYCKQDIFAAIFYAIMFGAGGRNRTSILQGKSRVCHSMVPGSRIQEDCAHVQEFSSI